MNTTFDIFFSLISIQGSSDLLASGAGGPPSAQDASWKSRLLELKKTADSSTAPGPTPQPTSGPTSTPSSAPPPVTIVPASLVSKDTYNKLKNELELKKGELKVALRRVEELSGNIKDTSLESAKKVAAKIKRNFFANRANRAANDAGGIQAMTEIGVDDLRMMKKEIHDLEDVLNATEEKLETVTRESKVLKQILQQPQAYLMTNTSMLSPSPSPDKAGRRLSQIPSELIDGNTPSPAAILQHIMITSHHHLMDQVLFWRKLTLKRLTASLSALPVTGQFAREESERAAAAAVAAKAASIAAVKSHYNINSSLNKINAKSVKFEVVDKPFKNELLDGKALYRNLRLMRAECVRVATIEDDGKDLEQLQAKIAQRPPLSLRDTITPLNERVHALSTGKEDGFRSRRCKSHTSVLMFRIVQENQAPTGQ